MTSTIESLTVIQLAIFFRYDESLMPIGSAIISLCLIGCLYRESAIGGMCPDDCFCASRMFPRFAFVFWLYLCSRMESVLLAITTLIAIPIVNELVIFYVK